MKLFLFFIGIFQIGILNVACFFMKNSNVFFFENANFQGKFSLIYTFSYLANFITVHIIYIKGKFLVVDLVSKDCIHLPNNWKNRISSILANKCIILYTKANCKSDNLRATILKDKVYFDDNLKHPSKISSYKFFGPL